MSHLAPPKSAIKTLRQSFQTRLYSPLLSSLTLLGNTLANGNRPPDAEFLTTSGGNAIGKEDKGAASTAHTPNTNSQPAKPRPIGVNESFIALLSKLMLKIFDSQIKKALTHDDYGYGVQNGCEIIVHALQARFLSNAPFYAAETDYENAYNTVSRALVFKVAGIYCPGMLPFLKLRYANMNLIFRDIHGEVLIQSTSGVSQGCPLSSALFQMTMSYLLKPIREKYGAIIASYQDDNALTSDRLSILDAMFFDLEQVSLLHNLRFNFTKMWLISNRSFPENFDALYPTLAKMRRTNDGIKILGGYVGKPSFIRTQIRIAVAKIFKFFQRVHGLIQHAKVEFPLLQHTQLLLYFVRYCCPPKVSYLIRVTDTRHIEPLLLPIDKAVASLLISLVDLSHLFRTPAEFTLFRDFVNSQSPNDLRSEASIIFSRIFLRRAGLGFASAVSNAVPAFLASIAASAAYIQRDLARTSLTHRDGALILDTAPLDIALRGAVLQQHQAELEEFLPSFQPATSRIDVQSFLSDFTKPSFYANVDANMLDLSRNGELVNPRTYPKFVSRSQNSASLWSNAKLRNHASRLTDEETRDAILGQIGIQPFLPANCCYCLQTIRADRIEEHAFSPCGRPAQSTSGSATEKAVGYAAELVGIVVTQPQARCRNLPGWTATAYNLASTEFTNHMADFVFTTPTQSFAVDVCYTGRFSDKPIHATIKLHAATYRAKEKYAKYNRLYNYPQDGFNPLALEAHGAIDDRLSTMLTTAHHGPHGPNYNLNNLNYGLTGISIALRKTCTRHFNCIRYHTRPTTTSTTTTTTTPT
jgi:hypothetical protein